MLNNILTIDGALNSVLRPLDNIIELGRKYGWVKRVYIIGAGSSYYASMHSNLKSNICIYPTPSSEFMVRNLMGAD